MNRGRLSLQPGYSRICRKSITSTIDEGVRIGGVNKVDRFTRRRAVDDSAAWLARESFGPRSSRVAQGGLIARAAEASYKTRRGGWGGKENKNKERSRRARTRHRGAAHAKTGTRRVVTPSVPILATVLTRS